MRDAVFAYLDCFSGVSGDKFLGALIGAGLPVDTLSEQLRLVPLDGYELFVHPVRKAGMVGTQVEVIVEPGQPSRDWRAIRALIESSSLDRAVVARALEAFRALAEAEGEAHGVAPEDVHFHEVGAVDSIVDIVGSAIGVAALGIEDMWASEVRVGRGTVETAHGTLPVPAPATARLLRSIPTYAGDFDGEMTTPTGAALLRTFVSHYGPMPAMRSSAEGWGAGCRDFPLPNLLRLTVGEREPGHDGVLTEVVVLESAIDHVTPELLAATIDIMIEEGALDAFSEPIQMKKRRLGAQVTVIASPGDAERLSDLLMLHTGTLGVRRTPTWRQVAPRRVETVTTSLGIVRVKVQGDGASLRVRPENDDVVAVARSTGMPLDKVLRVLTQEAEAVLGGPRDQDTR